MINTIKITWIQKDWVEFSNSTIFNLWQELNLHTLSQLKEILENISIIFLCEYTKDKELLKQLQNPKVNQYLETNSIC